MEKRNLKTLLLGLVTLTSLMFASCASLIEQDAKTLARYTCQTNYLFEQSQESSPTYSENGAVSAEKYNALIIQFDSVKKEFEKVYTDEKSKKEFQNLFDKYSKDCESYIKELTEQSSNSDEKTENTSSTSMSVESAVLFDELNGDLAIANEKYTNKRIVIKNMLLYGGYVNKEQKRSVFCTPYDVQKKKMGVYISGLATTELLENFNLTQLTAFFTEYKENKESLYGTSVYYLGNDKLGILNEDGRKYGSFCFELRDPTDYKKFKLPSLVKLNDPQNRNYPSYIASFTELVDIEATITEIRGGANSPAYLELNDAVIVKQSPYPLTENTAIATSINSKLDNKTKENEMTENAKSVKGIWSGTVDGKNVKLDIYSVDEMGNVLALYTFANEPSHGVQGNVKDKKLSLWIDKNVGNFEFHYTDLNYNTELRGYLINNEDDTKINMVLKRH
jgi:hypothetical protein